MLDPVDQFDKFIALDTSIDSLLKYGKIDLRSFKALNKIDIKNVGNLLKLNPEYLLNVSKAGRKTMSIVQEFINKYSYLLEEISEEIEEIEQMPLSRLDLCFLSDEQYDFVNEHWDAYNTIPAAFILYYFAITSSERNNIIIREHEALLPNSTPLTLEELGKKNGITRERARQISLKWLKIPSALNVARTQLMELLPKSVYCFDAEDFSYIVEREHIPGGVNTFGRLLACLFNTVYVRSFVPNGKTYIVSRRLIETYPLKSAFKQIDTTFKLSPEIAPNLSIDQLVRINRNSLVFQELHKVYEEYITYYYSAVSKMYKDGSEAVWARSHVCVEKPLKIKLKKDSVTDPSIGPLAPVFVKYSEAINRIYISSISGQFAPHKPIFILTLIELIRSNKITENRFYFDDILEQTFKECWNKFNNRTVYSPNVNSPFTSLTMDGFWHVVTKNSVKKLNNSPSWLKREVDYAFLDEELFQVLQVTTFRNKLRHAIIKNFNLNDNW